MNSCIFDIQGFSVHDGPGCRTVVFMKGCTLKCKWCSNPEGIMHYPVPLFNKEKCIYDGLCVKECDKAAIRLIKSKANPYKSGQKSKIIIDRKLCEGCNEHKCADACQTGALKIAGNYISADDLYNRLQRDRDYWGEKGGMTLTGGEPLSQPEFATEILKKCYESYIHTAIETCGNVHWRNYAVAINYIDWIFFDIKHMNTQKHKEWTGAGNKLIIENAEKLAQNFKGRIIIRIPLIPGFNDSEEEISDIADFMVRVGFKEVNILPVHHLGREKYNLLQLPYYNQKPAASDQQPANSYKELFEKMRISCYERYKTPF